MNYWMNLFTGGTWDEFRAAGASVSGFRHRMRRNVARLQPGDILLCYMTGVMRWIGALEVVGPSDDTRDIWSVADFPVRVAVKPLIMLEAETGIPMRELEGRVSFYRDAGDAGKFRGIVRGCPKRFENAPDGDLVLQLLREAERNPTPRAVDPKKLARKPLFRAERRKGRKAVPTLVSVPERDEAETPSPAGAPQEAEPVAPTEHTATQHLLLKLGAEMGFDVWVARNDRGRACPGGNLGSMPQMVEELPTQFNEATNKTVELIDVLWLKGNSIIAAFEVECTTAVYSGLLRMSDLLALQPNLNIKLYIVAPEQRRAKVEQEILRPTFALRQRRLCETCGFLGIEDLTAKIDGARELGLVSSLKPGFLEDFAEYFTDTNDG